MENKNVCFNNVLDEIKYITANAVAKKQDEAKINYPQLIERIKRDAAKGFSSCIIPLMGLNEFDKKLLEADGFRVLLEDCPKDIYSPLSQFNPNRPIKQWLIKW